jgi:hypothetical protein
MSETTYTWSPSTCTKIKLPLRCWLFWLLLSTSFVVVLVDLVDSSSPSGFFSRLYVPITANSGLRGKNSMQLGGRSSLKEVRDRMVAMIGRCSCANTQISKALVA